jgi:hypothetical protein
MKCVEKRGIPGASYATHFRRRELHTVPRNSPSPKRPLASRPSTPVGQNCPDPSGIAIGRISVKMYTTREFGH